jgi:hypothetical protein
MSTAHPAAEFIVAMFGPHKNGRVCITSLPNVKTGAPDGAPIYTRSTQQITDFIAKHDRPGFGCFVCVNPIKDKATRRAEETVTAIVCAHTDIDFAQVEESPEEIERIVMALPWTPSRVHHSGHGLHLFWFLDPALDGSPESKAAHKQLLKQIANLLGGDPAACLIPQLMRLPGTTNSKNGEQHEVRILSRPNFYFDHAILTATVGAIPAPLLHRKDADPKSGNGASPDNPFEAFAAAHSELDVDQLLADMVYLGAGGGGNAHRTILRCSAALLTRGEERDDVIERCLAALALAAARSGRSIDPARERVTIAEMCDSWIAKHPEIEEHESDEAPESPQPPPPKPAPYILHSLNAVLLRASKWLWPGHLPQGALEITSGGLGIGKGLLACDHAARVTTNRTWPDGSPGCEIGTVIVISAEDNVEDFKRRFMAAGADEQKVKILEHVIVNGRHEPFLIARDLKIIEMICRDLGDVRLIIIDPITAFMGSGRGFDSHRASDVRAQLLPLKIIAEKLNVTFSALTHPTKNAAAHAVIDNFIGSQAFIATARVGHYCIEELDEEDERGFRRPTGRVLFAHARRPSHSAPMPTLAFHQEIVRIGLDPDTEKAIEVPRLVWDKDPIDLTADEALARNKPKYGDGRKQRGQSVRAFLLTLLETGPQPAATIIANGAFLGFSFDQLKYARKQIGVVTYRLDKIGTSWFWALPQHVPPGAIFDQ